jgi:hypothetical protein
MFSTILCCPEISISVLRIKIALEFWLRPKVLLKHFQVFILSLSVQKLNGGEELVYLGISF